ncbi:MAG TPA: hypothetical protein VGE07_27730, partial [Herpetosiphonaceae bacterium]
IMAALSQAQHDRPASALAFKQALLGLAAAPPAPAPRPGAPPATGATAHIAANATIALPQVQRAWESWPVVMAESFRDNRNKWSVMYTDNEYMVGERRVGVGRLHFNITSRQRMVTKSTPESLRAQPRAPGFYIEAQMLRVAGTTQVSYGLLFARCNANDYYSFQICDDQRYAMWVFRDNVWTTLIGWTYAPMIRQAKWNKLAALVQGPRITLMINDQYATDLDNDELPGGSAGLVIEYNAEGLHGIVECANFVVRAAPT